MVRYIGARLVQGLAVVVGAVIVSFVLANMAGNPADAIGNGLLPREARRQLAEQLGYDQPLLGRLATYLERAARGDFGSSYRTGASATASVLAALPNTLILVACALALALALAVPIAILSVLRRGSRLDGSVRTATLLVGSLPDFWVALVLILVFTVTLGLLPSVGFEGPSSLVLPAIALGLPYVPTLARVLRGSLLDVGERDFVTGLRAKGFSERYILLRHGMKNALVPFATLVALQAGSLLGGTLIVEVVFGWPGVGWLLVDAVSFRDIALVQATVVVIAVAYVLLNLAADVLAAVVDPRIAAVTR